MSDDTPFEPSGRTMEGPPFDDDDDENCDPERKRKLRRKPRSRRRKHHESIPSRADDGNTGI